MFFVVIWTYLDRCAQCLEHVYTPTYVLCYCSTLWINLVAHPCGWQFY